MPELRDIRSFGALFVYYLTAYKTFDSYGASPGESYFLLKEIARGSYMKLISISFGSWLIGLSALLIAFSAEGDTSLADLKGVTIISLVVAALLFSLAYAPSLFWLRKRLGGCRPAALFPVTSALVLNLPVFLITFLAIGRTLGAVEALAFIGAFVLMGTAFGLAFVWNYQNRDIKSATWH